MHPLSGSLPRVRYRNFPAIASHGSCIDVKTLNQLPLDCIELDLFALCPPPTLLLSRTGWVSRRRIHRISTGGQALGVMMILRGAAPIFFCFYFLRRAALLCAEQRPGKPERFLWLPANPRSEAMGATKQSMLFCSLTRGEFSAVR